jgi:hypothetical protein
MVAVLAARVYNKMEATPPEAEPAVLLVQCE